MSLFLDTGILGMVTHPLANIGNNACLSWMMACIDAGSVVCVPEIADYELRREYVRTTNKKSLARLEQMNTNVAEYVPITTGAMREAANLWAKMRNEGTPTAQHFALDGDVILAAQAQGYSAIKSDIVIVVTTNVAHLSRLTVAKMWTDLPITKY